MNNWHWDNLAAQHELPLSTNMRGHGFYAGDQHFGFKFYLFALHDLNSSLITFTEIGKQRQFNELQSNTIARAKNASPYQPLFTFCNPLSVRMKIAQPFMAGIAGPKIILSPVRDERAVESISFVPGGTYFASANRPSHEWLGYFQKHFVRIGDAPLTGGYGAVLD